MVHQSDFLLLESGMSYITGVQYLKTCVIQNLYKIFVQCRYALSYQSLPLRQTLGWRFLSLTLLPLCFMNLFAWLQLLSVIFPRNEFYYVFTLSLFFCVLVVLILTTICTATGAWNWLRDPSTMQVWSSIYSLFGMDSSLQIRNCTHFVPSSSSALLCYRCAFNWLSLKTVCESFQNTVAPKKGHKGLMEGGKREEEKSKRKEKKM